MGIFSKYRDDSECGGTYWSTSCLKDPRFNLSGTSGSISSSGLTMDQAIRAKQAELKLSDEYMDTLTIEISSFKR
jgi:hypothetical protein